jgi:type IV secretory pathway VirB2 component (pilin)
MDEKRTLNLWSLMAPVNKEHHRQPSYQAYQILRLAFTVAPIVAGLDKFFNLLTNWSQYLASPFNVFGNAATTMMVVGVIEVIAGIGVWFKPKVFAYVVALWLLGIIVNLLALQNFYDIALRDLGLLLGALALARLSVSYNR